MSNPGILANAIDNELMRLIFSEPEIERQIAGRYCWARSGRPFVCSVEPDGRVRLTADDGHVSVVCADTAEYWRRTGIWIREAA